MKCNDKELMSVVKKANRGNKGGGYGMNKGGGYRMGMRGNKGGYGKKKKMM